MYLDSRGGYPGVDHRLFPRRTDRRTIAWVGGIVVFIVIALLLACLISSHRGRPSNRRTGTSFFGRFKNGWKIRPYSAAYRQTPSADDAPGHNPGAEQSSAATTSGGTRGTAAAAAGVDRNTSIRSIMTLPAYRSVASTNETVLGREGERGGVDIVVEQPTAEQEEALREEEMEALYQVRLLRRQQLAARDERRQLRRDARSRNDFVALEELRDRARADNSNALLEELRRDHERLKDQRKRSASSVSYDGLGVARHDGTRIRASSTESTERVGLLSDAASLARSTRSRATSGADSSLRHQRQRSASSVLSLDSDMRSRADSGAETPRFEMIEGEADLADSEVPPHSPPGYEDISLDDVRSAATTPNNNAPPDYAAGGDAGRASPGPGDVPRLPSLRLRDVPQIVVEPSAGDHESASRP